jgi:hypothetical protein
MIKKTLILMLLGFILIFSFTGNVFAQVSFEFSFDYSGRTYVNEPHYVSGPTLDFTFYPFTLSKEDNNFIFGFGLTSGALFGYQITGGTSYSVVVPIQLHIHIDINFAKVSESFFLITQFKIGGSIGASSLESDGGFIFSFGVGAKYLFIPNFGIKLLLEYGMIIFPDSIPSGFCFSFGLILRI